MGVAIGLARTRLQACRRLGNDIRGQLILDEGNSVAQGEFALFEPLNLDNVRTWGPLQGFDCRIKVAMLLSQSRKLRPKLGFFLFGHYRRIPMPLRCGGSGFAGAARIIVRPRGSIKRTMYRP
jgi:hypothetical protein